MYRADKFYGPERQVLANISLSFLPGAKIGVLGPNGAGKSTLLRIMAGKDEPSSGVAELAPGATSGLLEQEPELDPAKDVRGNVEDGVRPLRDLLDLDEPTNHLDAESVLWLERFLADYKGTVVAVTHDRYFLDNVAGWILELDRGRGIPFQGNYSSWLEQKQDRLAHEEKQESARRRTLARELEWVRASPRARYAKAKARLGAYERLFAREQNGKLDRVEIDTPSSPRGC